MSSSGPSIDSRPSLTKSEKTRRPAVSERVNQLYEWYPEKARAPLYAETRSGDPRVAYDPGRGVSLRKEVVRGTNGGDTFSLTHGGVVRAFLEFCEDRREPPTGRFEDFDGELFEVEFSPHSYHPDYLGGQYAKLMGLSRELEAECDRPGTALLALTSGGAGKGAVDHQLERREAWGPTYDALRYVMGTALEAGRITDWGYVIVEEQHPGSGLAINAGLGHDHPMIWFDGELDRDDFRPVVAAWIEACPGAQREAHQVDHPDPEKRCVDVRRVDPEAETEAGGTITDLAGYITKYLWPDGGDADPIERPIERIMYEATKWATNTRRLRKSDNSNWAIKADLCRQKSERVDGRPAHGERLTHEDGRGPEIVCAECGSGWGIDPEAGTIVEARRPDEPTAELVEIVTPDGEVFKPSGGGVETRTVLGWDFAPRGLAEVWADEDRMGRAPAELLEAPPAPNARGEVWDRPPPD